MIKGNFPELAEHAGTKLGLLFSRLPITANQWTMLSLVPAAAGFIELAFEKRMDYALACFAVSALIDGIDGGVARVTGSVSAIGAYLDGMVDRFVEAALLVGLMVFGIPRFEVPGYLWAVAVLFLGTCMTSYSRAYAHHRKALDDDEVKHIGGFFERAERIVVIFAGMVAYFISPIYLAYALALAAVLSGTTVLERMMFVVLRNRRAS